MGSLSEVIRQLISVVDNPIELHHPLQWPIPGLRSCLKLCSRHKLGKWHDRVLRDYGSQAPHDRRFLEVQERIYACLKSASKRSHTLRQWTKGRESRPPNVVGYRHLVILAQADVLEAFNQFCNLRGHPVGIVLAYLKKCYGFMICLGQLLHPHGDGDNWFTNLRDYLDLELPGFEMDGRSIRQVPQNPTLPGQIQDDTYISGTYLPHWPEPALVVRTRGPYGPALSKNLHRKPS